MRSLALLLLSSFAGVSGLFLAGCPDGVGLVDGQDGDPDADDDTDAAKTALDANGGVGNGSVSDDGDITTTGGSGALCGANGRDDCGAYAFCNATLGCVDCLGDSDCPAALPRCFGGTCTAPCTSDSGACSAGTTCDADAGVCAACGPHTPCAKGICSDTTRRCAQCASHADCGGTEPRCRVLVGSCVALLPDVQPERAVA